MTNSGRSTPTATTPLLGHDSLHPNHLHRNYLTERRGSWHGSNHHQPESIESSLQSSYRRPFHYPLNQHGRSQMLDEDLDASITYSRYKYYTRLSSVGADKFKIPDHIVPAYFYFPQIPWPIWLSSEQETIVKKQSSFVTIFAIWNLMMGTSLLVLPWALHQAGLVTGIILILLMSFICFYTALLVISLPKLAGIKALEFTDVVQHLLGRWAYIISLLTSLTTITGGCIVYWVLMSNFMYYAGSFIYEVTSDDMSISTNMSLVVCPSSMVNAAGGNSTSPHLFYRYWSLSGSVPFILAALLFPVISLKSVHFFMKFNVVGSLSVIYLILFSMYKSWVWGVVNVNFTDKNSVSYTPLYRSSFLTMSGVLSLALFIHNFIISLLSTQKKPENNRRDLAIAYILVCVTYLMIAGLIYLGFPIAKNCLQDNFLNNLVSNDILAFLTRVFLLIQIIALYPLLVYMLRVQVMNILSPNSAPSYFHISCLNLALTSLCICFAVFFPRIGTIIRYCGSFSGLVFIFAFPPLAYLKAKQLSGQKVSLTETLFHYLIVALGLCNCLGQFLIT